MKELVSKLPPNCGDVSATTLPIPVAMVKTFGSVASGKADAKTILSPLSVAANVTELPEPVAYLN